LPEESEYGDLVKSTHVAMQVHSVIEYLKTYKEKGLPLEEEEEDSCSENEETFFEDSVNYGSTSPSKHYDESER
jgi:hypothetical protein